MINEKESQVINKKEHLLVGLSSSPSNEKIITTAYQMAKAFKGSLTAIYVQTIDSINMSLEDKERLQKNISFAEKLGATIVIVNGDNVSFQISEYARLSNVTKIIVGRSFVSGKKIMKKQTIVDQLMSTVSNIDIYIIPDFNVEYKKEKLLIKQRTPLPSLKDVLLTIAILLIQTLIGYLFMKIGFTESNIIMVYILGVLVTSIITDKKICWILSSVLSVILFNFIFTFPHFSLVAYGEGYPITFAVMLIVSLIVGNISNKMRSQMKKATETAYRTKILFESNHMIQNADDDKQIIKVTLEQINKLVDKKVFAFLQKDNTVFTSSKVDKEIDIETKKEIIDYVIQNNCKGGNGTEHFPAEEYLYLPLSINKKMFGVIGIQIGDVPIEPLEKSLVMSIIGECALAVENHYNVKEKELNELLAKNEQVRANLLRAISHDLRTPLTSIIGNADNLLSNSDSLDETIKKQMYSEIYVDSIWLINLVENLLSITKLENRNIKLNYTTELIEDIINEALKHINKNKVEHSIVFEECNDLILVRVDARLIIQVIINLVDNAIKYTPKGSTITISVVKEKTRAIVKVIDNGCGIEDGEKEKIFNMFYTCENKIVDSRKSLGLGLSLCKSILNAHNCEISVSDNIPNGSIFTFDLPIEEVKIHE